MKIIDCLQYSPEWWMARRGIPTASAFDKIITSKGAVSKSCDRYIAELLAERMEQNPNFFTERGGHTVAQRNGINTEPEARRWVEMEVGATVRQIGFATTDDGRIGCSPDGMIQDEEFVELKCPELKTHAAWILKGQVIPREHRIQVQGQLVVGTDNGGPIKRHTWVSYAPGLAPLVVRTEPDEFTETVRKAVREFDARYQEATDKMLTREGDQRAETCAAVQAALKQWADRLNACDSLDMGMLCQKVNQLLPSLRDVLPAAKPACWQFTKERMALVGCVWNKEFKTFHFNKEASNAAPDR